MKIGIDPGHGGSDPGACNSTTGTRECDIALGVSLKLRDMLLADGHEVVITRNSDIDVGYPNDSANEELGARVDILNSAGVDVVICIHCNGFDDPSANGTETFYYVEGRSSKLAQYVHVELVALGIRDRRGSATQANHYITRYTDAPAILTELGFVSNPDDENKLLNNQNDLAAALKRGIYNWQNS